MKQFLPVITVAVLFLSLVFSCLPVQATEVGGVISQDLTWTASGGPYTLTKSMLISSGVTLRIEPGATININSGCYLQINGTIIAQGTPGNKINFNGGYIKLVAASAGSIIEDCVFSSTDVSVYSCSPKIANNVFSSELLLKQFNATLTSNIFNGQVRFSGGSSLIKKNQFNQGLKLVESAGQNVQIIENKFTGYTDDAGINIGSNDLEGKCSLIIERNLISNNKYGIYDVTINSPTIRYNTIVNNKMGITLLDGQNQKFTINYNSIINPQNLVLISWTGCPNIDVSNNYWGTTDTNQIDNSIHDYYDDFILGTANYQPILTQPDSNAPAANQQIITPTPTPASTQLVTSEPSTTPTQTFSGDMEAFRINTNSTISAFSFDSSATQISFFVSGQEGTNGFFQLSIAKFLMPNADKIRVYLDGILIDRNVTSNRDYWIVTFNYHHSSHQVTINSSETTTNAGAIGGILNITTIAVIIAVAAVVLGLVVLRKRRRTRIDNPN